jgi:hypothetical protein
LQGGQEGTRANSDAIGRYGKHLVEGIHFETFRQIERIYRGTQSAAAPQGDVREDPEAISGAREQLIIAIGDA